jgi:DNA topoisomerase-1
MVWLASDEDRVAISWHLAEELNLDSKKTSVLFFMRLLKMPSLKAIDPREIDYNLVNAQQARRVGPISRIRIFP